MHSSRKTSETRSGGRHESCCGRCSCLHCSRVSRCAHGPARNGSARAGSRTQVRMRKAARSFLRFEDDCERANSKRHCRVHRTGRKTARFSLIFTQPIVLRRRRSVPQSAHARHATAIARLNCRARFEDELKQIESTAKSQRSRSPGIRLSLFSDANLAATADAARVMVLSAQRRHPRRPCALKVATLPCNSPGIQTTRMIARWV